jgi:hypothetical protein
MNLTFLQLVLAVGLTIILSLAGISTLIAIGVFANWINEKEANDESV